MLPNYDQCLDAGKQTITAELGYISSGSTAQGRRQGDRSAAGGGGGSGGGSSGGVAVLAHGDATPASTTQGLTAFGGRLPPPPPCPMELLAESGQRINFTLFDFAPRNRTYPSTASQLHDYDDSSGLSKICHRSNASVQFSSVHFARINVVLSASSSGPRHSN